MKKLILTHLFIIFTGFAFSQKQMTVWQKMLEPIYSNFDNVLDCNATTNNCNLVLNPELTVSHPGNIWGAFSEGMMDYWDATHGSPFIDNPNPFYNLFPPFPGIHSGYAFARVISNAEVNCEGFVGRIKELDITKNYSLTFYLNSVHENYQNNLLTDYNIYLIHCSDVETYFPDPNSTFQLPAIPPNSQQIFCEPNLANTDWHQVTTCFTPNQNYDAIWIFPVIHNPNLSNVGQIVYMGFAYPQLITQEDVSINVATDPSNNCIKILSPSCVIKNATYVWSLNGTPFSTAQNPTINTSTNFGVVTMQITPPNTNSNNSCFNTTCNLQASVTLSVCELWPKIYAAKTAQYLGKDNNGNLFMYLHEADLTAPMLNHIGWLPPNPTINDEYTFHYTTSGGVTTWGKTNLKPSIALNSGDIQLFNATTSFYNATNGNSSNSPGLVPPNEIILAETNAGEFITKDQNNIIYAHSSSFGLPAVLNLGAIVSKTIFKQNLNQLFVLSNGFPGPHFDVYNYNSGTNQWNAVSSSILAPDPPGGGNPTTFMQVDNQGKVYMIKDHMLQEYNYLSNPATFTQLSINGFDNQNLLAVTSYNNYTEDKCMVIHQTESVLYAIDLSAMTKKKINITNLSNSNSYRCAFDGNNVYLSAFIVQNGVTIGNQTIPALGPDFYSTFLTKFNLLIDFNFGSGRSHETIIPENKISFDAALSPNPVYNALKIDITENGKQSRSAYTISIVNHMGITVLRKEKYISDSYLNISSLGTGVYYVEIVNNRGQKISKPMRKL